ncbi:MAG: YhcH/YjgK/YiaL family protein [Eggerthellaceae bacterium]
MLVTTLDHAAGNDYLAARFQKAYAFLNRDDLGSLPLGRVDIDGDAVFANVQEYDTVPAEEKQLEAHRRYYDVQFVVSGEEVQHAPLEGLAKVQPFDEDADFGLYCTPERPSSIVLRAGDVAVLAPEDASSQAGMRARCPMLRAQDRRQGARVARMDSRAENDPSFYLYVLECADGMVHGLHRGRRRTRARA